MKQQSSPVDDQCAKQCLDSDCGPALCESPLQRTINHPRERLNSLLVVEAVEFYQGFFVLGRRIVAGMTLGRQLSVASEPAAVTGQVPRGSICRCSLLPPHLRTAP